MCPPRGSVARVPRFTIRDTDGETLGVEAFATGPWGPGDRIPKPPGPEWIVTKVIDGDGDELPILVVDRQKK